MPIPSDLTIYSDRPWLFSPVPDEVAALFADAPLRVLPAGSRMSFGSAREVHWVKDGLFATYAGFRGEFRLMTGLFGPGALLGAVKAFTHPGRRMELRLRAVADTTIATMDAVRFRQILAESDGLRDQVFRYLLVMHERQLDGLLMAEYLPLADRLALLIATLYDVAGVPLSPILTPVPYPVTASDLAVMLHSERASVSRVLSNWRKHNAFRREGRTLLFTASILPTPVKAA